MPYKISGTKNNTARVIVVKESDWVVESSTMIYGSGAYEVDNLVSGTKFVAGIAESGRSDSYSNVISEYYILPLSGTGGTITESGGYRIHTFTTDGTFTVTGGEGDVEVLVVAGGGAGGHGGAQEPAGGGGAGGLLYNASHAVTPQAYSITVGTGGLNSGNLHIKGGNGENSVFDSFTAIGGGGGVSGGTPSAASVGGSGGGGNGYIQRDPGAGTPGQGYDGGSGTTGTGNYAGGGGGGASEVGEDGNIPASEGGIGGDGLQYSISGAPTYYAGGGGGAGWLEAAYAAGGLGGGGEGGIYGGRMTGISATANTGGGGGGAAGGATGGNGGSGIVIIKYLIT